VEMRRYANMKSKEALENTNNNVAWGLRHDCIVCDYCQNMALPFFGKDQPGATYYYSPLTMICFGVANVGIAKHKLKAFIYNEGDGSKGGNSVSSFLFNYLKQQGWYDTTKGSRKELTIIMDNCGGQNKNRMVLRFAVLLVELGVYERVNCTFLVAGHTKNSCDRLFNLLKLQYRPHNIFVEDDLMEKLNHHELIEAYRVKDEDFKDFDSFEDSYYRKLESGSVNAYQQFFAVKEFKIKDRGGEEAIRDTRGYLFRQVTTAEGREVQQQDLKKRGLDRDVMRDSFPGLLSIVPPLGVRPIKQVEMYDRWRKFVPLAHQDDPIYNMPDADTIAKVKGERGKKKTVVDDDVVDDGKKSPEGGAAAMPAATALEDLEMAHI